jgi:hypothetical protein
VSFVHALEIVRDAVPEFQQVAPTQRRALYERMLREIAARLVPERRPRSNPRVVKRKLSNFKRKRAEHREAPVRQRSVRAAIEVQPPPAGDRPPVVSKPDQAAVLEQRSPAPCLI